MQEPLPIVGLKFERNCCLLFHCSRLHPFLRVALSSPLAKVAKRPPMSEFVTCGVDGGRLEKLQAITDSFSSRPFTFSFADGTLTMPF